MACSYWIAAFSILALAGCNRSRPPLPDIATVPPFVLTDQSGRDFSSNTLAGKVWVADFIFTHCPGPCPRMSSRMRKLQDSVAGLRLVSFTVDPVRDTPAALAEYGKHFGAASNWYFLTGPNAVLQLLALKTFKLADINGDLEHSTFFVLVDKTGHVRGYYPSDSNEHLEELIADCNRLLKDQS